MATDAGGLAPRGSDDHHTGVDYAKVLKELSDLHFPAAEKIVLVQDDLSTHTPASLYTAFPADHPMTADHRSQGVGERGERGDVEARLGFDLAIGFPFALDHDDRLQARPLVVVLQPADVVEDGDRPGLDAAVGAWQAGVSQLAVC